MFIRAWPINVSVVSLPLTKAGAQALWMISSLGIGSFNLSQTIFFLYVLCHAKTGMADQPLL